MAQDFSVVSDSSIDLPSDERARLGIGTAAIQVALSRDYFRDDDLDRPTFYRMLKDEPRLPVIAAATPADFLAAYRKAHDRAERVLCLINPFESCSTYTAAYSAAVVAKRDHQITVDVLNTGRALTALGAICIEAAEFGMRGASLEDVVGALEVATPRIDTFYAPATVEYLRRDGRISIYEMKVGSLDRMLPLIRVWGRVAVVDKAPAREGNIERMVEMAADELEGNEATVIVTHADNPRGAGALADRVKDQLNCERVIVTELGPSAGAYCGAGTVGIGFCPRLSRLH